jgi:hypothetical protein
MTKIQKLALAGAAIAALCRVISGGPAHATEDPLGLPIICKIGHLDDGDMLNVRTRPRRGMVLAQIDNDTIVTALEKHGTWYYIQEKHGWINGRYLVDCNEWHPQRADPALEDPKDDPHCIGGGCEE